MMDWISAGDLHIPFGFVVDQVSVTMMTVVTLVSTIVHIYSIGYMDHDKSFNRFFSYLSAFVFSMMILVMSDNFAGLFIVYWNVGSLQYDVVFAELPNLSGSVLNAAAIALFIGAMGKSAQFPLHTWLTDAMEGPTPVSALIHAATMVTAGVFLVIRANPLFSVTPEVSYFIAALGTFVAFFAASMALVNRDLKRIIAFSTLSQLGYMFAAAGLGAYWIALFHLAAHAFFKALLFLGAGNVMHAMHDELDIFKMGGLKKAMKWTYIYMGLASLALAGIPFFAGFFSKDAIIETAWNEGTLILWFILVVTAGMTAFYSFRQVFLTFHGDERYKAFGIHPHEMYKFVLIAMSPLAFLAVVAGFGMGGFEHFVTKLLPEYHMSEHTHHIAWILGLVVLVFAVGGILLAYKKYDKGLKRDEKLENSFIYRLLANQYYIPQLYEGFITKPYAMLSEMMWTKVDMKIVDATVDGIAKLLYKSGDKTRKMQTGNLSNYLNWMAVGAVLLLVVAALSAMLG
jgi:NADH-quinone oxidoreductase subunit L